MIHGRVYEDAEHFHVDLIGKNQSGDSSIQDVALHFESRFNESKNVVNSFINGEWGSEEHGLLGLKPGQEFKLDIVLLKNESVIWINSEKIHRYAHRVPANFINQLLIDGDVILYKILYGGKYLTVPYEKDFPDGHF
uniref:Galectin n=1 Tax=Panagrolaimus sp. JU765 TaxID=591449 RepID=A0AC34RSP8_9BILA